MPDPSVKDRDSLLAGDKQLPVVSSPQLRHGTRAQPLPAVQVTFGLDQVQSSEARRRKPGDPPVRHRDRHDRADERAGLVRENQTASSLNVLGEERIVLPRVRTGLLRSRSPAHDEQ